MMNRFNRMQAGAVRAPSGQSLQQTHAALGAEQTPGQVLDQMGELYNTIPAFFTITIDLASTVGATQSGSVQLRPEPFVCGRITWATNGDVPIVLGGSNFVGPGSAQGRVVEAQWSDEFTRFLGDKFCLLSALFADSQGFIDFPKPVLFQGKQTLSLTLRRLSWPTDSTPPTTTRFDFNFQGLSLLPRGVNQSGSAG